MTVVVAVALVVAVVGVALEDAERSVFGLRCDAGRGDSFLFNRSAQAAGPGYVSQ